MGLANHVNAIGEMLLSVDEKTQMIVEAASLPPPRPQERWWTHIIAFLSNEDVLFNRVKVDKEVFLDASLLENFEHILVCSEGERSKKSVLNVVFMTDNVGGFLRLNLA